MKISIIRRPERARRTGVSNTTNWRQEKAGLLPPRVQISANCVGWIEHELDAVLAARAAGADDAAIRALVTRLIDARTGAA